MSIQRILDSNSIKYKEGGNYYQIRCLSPDHTDNNPSMFVNKFTGWANCRSCEASYNIFSFFNAKPNWLELQKNKLRAKLQNTAISSQTYEFPDSTLLWINSCRDISTETLQHFEAFQCADFPGYICFPIKNSTGQIINFIGRDTTGTRKSKYILFYKKPVIMAPINNSYDKSVILVEGWFDFLNLFDKGIRNARCLFGTSTFSDETLNYLKIEGIEEVILLLDGDTAGRKAAISIQQKLEENYISVKKVNLPENKDPGDMTQTAVTSLKEQLYGKSSSNRNETEQDKL